MNKARSPIINTSRFFGDFTPIVPYMALFFMQKNISLSSISVLFLIFSLTVLLFEIPTGILADKINRKTVLVISRILKLACFATWLIWPSFPGFAIGFILWGLATALDSGAFQAFLYDHLHDHDAHDLFSKHYGNASSWSFIGLLCSALVAAGLIHFGWSYSELLILSIISMVISGTTFLFAPNPKEKTIQPKEELIVSTIRNNTGLIWKNNLLLTIFIIGITAGGIKGALEEYYPLLLGTNGVALSLIGISIAGFELMKSIGSFLAGHVPKNKTYQLLLLVIIGALMVGMGIAHSWVLLLVIAILTLIDATLWILNDTAIQDMSSSHNRATIASYKNFGTELIALIAFLAFSLTGVTQSVQVIYIVGGIGMIVISTVLAASNKIRRIKA